MTISVSHLEGRFRKIRSLVTGAVQMMRNASVLWVQTMKDLWDTMRCGCRAMAVGMLLVSIISSLCLVYFLIMILPWVMLGALVLLLIRAIGASLSSH